MQSSAEAKLFCHWKPHVIAFKWAHAEPRLPATSTSTGQWMQKMWKFAKNIWRFGPFSPLAHISKINKHTLRCYFKPCWSLFVRLILLLGYSFPLKSERKITCQILILANFLGGQNVPKLNHFWHTWRLKVKICKNITPWVISDHALTDTMPSCAEQNLLKCCILSHCDGRGLFATAV